MIWFIFLKVLFMSIAMTAAGAMVWIASRLFKKFLSERAVYYLWLVAMIPALVPTFGVKYQKPQSNTYRAVSSAVVSEVKTDAVHNESDDIDDVPKVTDLPKKQVERLNNFTYELKNLKSTSLPYREIISILYVIGVLVCMLRYAINTARFSGKLKPLLCEVKPNCEGLCREKVNFRGRADIFTADTACSPFVYGVLRPRVIIPSADVSAEAIMHEFVHIKRRDLLCMRLVSMIKAVHFFNPFVYLFASKLRKCMELSCDETVSRTMTDEEKLSYSRCIVNHTSVNVSGGVCLSENGKNIKERIEVIMKKRNYSKSTRIAGVIIAAALIMCQTVFAAVISTGAPDKAYVINHTNDIRGVLVTSGGDTLYCRRPNKSDVMVSVINDTLYKGFSADIKAEFKGLNSKADYSKKDIHVEMDKFIKAFDGGKHWQGLFTVVIDGEAVLENSPGYINDIPCSDACRETRLYIGGGEVTFQTEKMNFGLEGDSVINAEHDEEESERFEPKLVRALEGTAEIKYKTDSKLLKEKRDELYLNISANPAEKRLICKEIPMAGICI